MAEFFDICIPLSASPIKLSDVSMVTNIIVKIISMGVDIGKFSCFEFYWENIAIFFLLFQKIWESTVENLKE